MRAILYMYDIPTTVSPKDYPNPSAMLRRFAARIEYSCWVVPEGLIQQTEPVSAALRRVGARVDMVRFDESEEQKILMLARRSIEREASRIRAYIEKSIETTGKKLADAKAAMSVDDTNAAIRFQQTAIQRARTELNDAESCAIAFDLLGDIGELVRSIRSVVEARANAFILEKKAARKAVKEEAEDDDETTTADGSSAPMVYNSAATNAADPTLPFGSPPSTTDDEEEAG